MFGGLERGSAAGSAAADLIAISLRDSYEPAASPLGLVSMFWSKVTLSLRVNAVNFYQTHGSGTLGLRATLTNFCREYAEPSTILLYLPA